MPDLGVLPPKDGPMSVAPSSPEGEKKKQYPSFTLRDEQVERVKGEHSCDVDDRYTATVVLRVSGINHDTYGKRMEFEVESLDGFAPAGTASKEEPAEENNEGDVPSPDAESESKVLGYDRQALIKSRKAPKKGAPGGDGKDLAY